MNNNEKIFDKILNWQLSSLQKQGRISIESTKSKIKFIENEINDLIENEPLFFKKKWRDRITKLEDIKIKLYKELEQDLEML